MSLMMCISKISTDSCAIKTKNKNKKYFCKVVCSVLVVKKFS